MITFADAKYLKHAGDISDVKVTIRILDGYPVIFIRDGEYRTFKSALRSLQHIVENEMITQPHSKFHVICAWCKKVLRPIEGTKGDSHGICEECEAKVEAEIGEDK